MSKPRTNHPSDDELTAGEEALASAADLIAKAADADLDADFGDYDKAAAASAEPDEDEEGGDATDEALEGEDDLGMEGDMSGAGEDDPESDEDEDEEPEGAGGGEPFAKAADGDEVVVDALPLLQSIDAHMAALREDLATMRTQNRALLGIAKAQQAAIGHFAKANDAIAGMPTTPKSQRPVRVATAAPAGSPARDINTLFAKAAEVVEDPSRFGTIEHFYNRKDVEGMIGALLPSERERVLATPKE